MKFKGTGVVWDAENNKVLVEFENGIVETTDQRVIDILNKNGFKEFTDQVQSETQKGPTVRVGNLALEDNFEVEETKPNPRKEWNDLKRKAVSLGLKVQGKSREQLLAEIKEKENVDHIN